MNDGFFPEVTAIIFRELLARKVDETAAGEIAEQVAIEIMRRFAGMDIYIPNGGKRMIGWRNAKVLKLRAAGVSVHELSQKFGISGRQIHSILKRGGMTSPRKEKKP
jgi:Mor family transcriptional regulator